MINFLRTVITRPIFLYLVCFFVIWAVLDYNKLMNNAIGQTMSRLTPPMSYFKEFPTAKGPYNRLRALDCIYYHKQVVKYYPYQKAEALGMMAFCYSRLGDLKSSEKYYKEAIEANPIYFWPHYNLGVIAFKQGLYAKSAEHLKNALSQDIAKSMVLLTRSKVYLDVSLSDRKVKYNFWEALQGGRRQAYVMLMESLLKTADYRQLFMVVGQAFKEGHDDDIFYYYAGVSAYQQKALDKAVEFLQSALRKNPRNAEALTYLGLTLREAGQEEAAMQVLRQADAVKQQFGSLLERQLQGIDVRFF